VGVNRLPIWTPLSDVSGVITPACTFCATRISSILSVKRAYDVVLRGVRKSSGSWDVDYSAQKPANYSAPAFLDLLLSSRQQYALLERQLTRHTIVVTLLVSALMAPLSLRTFSHIIKNYATPV
jgi:hypothetical protein